MSENYDFCGWATRSNVRCADGRTIMPNAFLDNDGKVVPLVWNHRHDNPSDVLGHAILQNRKEGVYMYGTFNDTENGQTAKRLVRHGDITGLSIYANQLKQQSGCVTHGNIREVSLVHAGANPEAFIENVIQHGELTNEEAYIYIGEELELYHSAEKADEHPEKNELNNVDQADETVEDVFNTLTEKQKTVVYALIGQALEDNEGGSENMKHNVFENEVENSTVISHSDQEQILLTAKQTNCGSFKAALQMYLEDNSDSLAHGFESIEALFPDVQDLTPGAPDFIPQNDAWVRAWMNRVHKSPFNRVRTRQADISKIRASGYKTKGTQKKDMGNIKLVSRTTDPQTVYIKDELNRDDIIDITDFDVVAYEHGIMRSALDTELARAALFGDGRDEGDEQKINPEHIRPVWTDDELYTIHKTLDIESMKAKLQGSSTGANFGEEYIYAEAVIAAFRHAMEEYKGSGNVDCYCSTHLLNTMLLARDLNGRRIYDTAADLAKALHAREIIECDEIAGLKERKGTGDDSANSYELQALFINPADYNYGATKGGKTSHFSDFDIDFNKHKFLMETRLSGAMARVKSAIALELKVVSSGLGG